MFEKCPQKSRLHEVDNDINIHVSTTTDAAQMYNYKETSTVKLSLSKPWKKL